MDIIQNVTLSAEEIERVRKFVAHLIDTRKENFCPEDGICPYCKKQITGCPNCHRSYVE